MSPLLVALGATLLATFSASSQQADSTGSPTADFDYEIVRRSKVATAYRITEEIFLDGRLDEAVWNSATPATDFYQWQRIGEPATEQTEVRILYDDENIYFGIICFDSEIQGRVVNEITEDFNFRSTDGISVIIDSLHDRRSGFIFGTNPVGARRDQQIFNDGTTINGNWDGVWDVRVGIRADAWTAEYVIPFKTLRFSGSPSQEWGLNFSRRLLRLAEESMWAPIPVRFTALRLSSAGTLDGLEGIGQSRNLTVKPFVTGGMTQTRPPADASIDILTDGNFDGGMDLKYGLTPSLTLDATYRTDFAQVEADAQQVNLTRFNLFFPEQREFFLENAGTFSFGRGNNVIPFFSRRIGLSPSGTPIPIIGGTRLSGQVGRYEVGFLAMKTEDRGSTPSDNFVVGRLKRNLLLNSWIGAILTNRDSTIDGDYNRVYGADAFFQFDRLEFDSYVLISDTPGLYGKNQARKFGTAWRDDELEISAQYEEVGTNFNPEVGFVRRDDNTHYSGAASWSPRLTGSEAIRNVSVGTTTDYYEGGNGNVETREQGLNFGMQFENSGSVSFDITETFDRLNKATRIRGLTVPQGDYRFRRYSANFRTDTSEKISGSGGASWGEFWDGHLRSYTVGLGVKPDYRVSIELTYRRDLAELSDGSSTSDLVGARFDYGFSPRSFLNAFFQYNGATQEVSTNIRFNIMYRPLSDLYIVYNDRRSTDTGQLIDRAFIVKLTNLVSF
jgi:hypothetical protein